MAAPKGNKFALGNEGGRPPNSSFADGEYTFDELKDCLEKDFINEKELCNFLEKNIKDFCSDFLDVEYESHIREYKLIKTSRSRLKGNRRIDFFIKSRCGKNIIVECKHPITLCELSPAVGQCLSYISLLRNLKIELHKTILLSSKIDNVITQVISDYNLPIEFMVMDKTKCIKFSRHASR